MGTEQAQKKKDETKKENAKADMDGQTVTEKITNYVDDKLEAAKDWMNSTTEEAEAKAKEEGHKASREKEHQAKSEGYKQKRDMEWEKAKDSDETMSERAAGAKNAAKHQVNSMTEQAQKKKDETKKENAKADMDGQTVTEKIT